MAARFTLRTAAFAVLAAEAVRDVAFRALLRAPFFAVATLRLGVALRDDDLRADDLRADDSRAGDLRGRERLAPLFFFRAPDFLDVAMDMTP